MTIYSGIFNSVRDSSGNGDRKYNAWWFAKYFSTFIGNGVFPNPSTNLQVLANANMTVKVSPGSGWIDGYFIYSDTEHVLQLDIADGVLKRIDRVVMRLNYLTRQIEIAVKKGAFASSPVAPTLQRDADYVELALADVLINNGATVITQANITDTRLNNSLCGIVQGTVNQVDTTTIFNQYLDWFNSLKNSAELEMSEFQTALENSVNQWLQQEQSDFEAWFATLQDLLDENIATTLTVKVQELEQEFDNHSTNTNNPHAVTKTQVGLSNVLNYGIATQAEAEAGTSTSKYMTPQRTQQAIAKTTGVLTNLQTTAKGNLVAAINEVFTNGNNVKRDTVNALLSVDDSLPITTTSAWNAIITQIGNISTGKKWASGVATLNTSKIINVTGLSFTPKIIITEYIYDTTNGYGYRRIYVNGWDDFNNKVLFSSAADSYNRVGSFTINNDGFSVQAINVNYSNTTCNWIAFE